MALTELKSLSLSNNRISEIEAGTFKGLTNLQVLKLNGNNISAVGKQALSPCLRTQEVDLSNNIILAVEESAFEGLSSLRTLKLNHNKLTSLSPGVFTTNVRLSTLNLSDNPWHCNCALLDLKDWLKFSSERMLAVFVMCAQPQSLKGRYLDLISSELIKSADTGCMDMMLSDEPSGLSKPTGMPEISVMPTLTFTSLDLTTADGVRKIESKRHIVNTDLDQHFTTEATPSKNTAMIQTLGMATGQLQPKDFSAKDACSYNQMGIVNISARLVTSNSAKIVWTLVNTEHQHAYFRIMYDQFDGDIRFSRFINIKQGNVCILRDLRPSTAYFVCVESVVNETVCPVASRDLCVGIVTKDEKRSTLDPQTLTLYISAANAVAVAMTLIIIIGVIILKNRKRKSGDTVSMVYSQHRQVSCAVCVGQPSDYNSGYQSNSSQTGTYQPNEIDAIDLPQGD
ncbi:TLR4 interactor with leucine rich repeats [Amia ocellicauda]|uniref:TLR4 interactor with leucine rich repeats n=1 Tax=Amia ocellicauda TaxID=2972642 RepID=UPI0034648892